MFTCGLCNSVLVLVVLRRVSSSCLTANIKTFRMNVELVGMVGATASAILQAAAFRKTRLARLTSDSPLVMITFRVHYVMVRCYVSSSKRNDGSMLVLEMYCTQFSISRGITL